METTLTYILSFQFNLDGEMERMEIEDLGEFKIIVSLYTFKSQVIWLRNSVGRGHLAVIRKVVSLSCSRSWSLWQSRAFSSLCCLTCIHRLTHKDCSSIICVSCLSIHLSITLCASVGDTHISSNTWYCCLEHSCNRGSQVLAKNR